MSRCGPLESLFRGLFGFLKALAAGSDESVAHGRRRMAWMRAPAAWLRAEGVGQFCVPSAAGGRGFRPVTAGGVGLATFHAAYYKSTATHMMLAAELEALLAMLHPLGVDPIVLKGMALGTTLYATPPTRPVSDVDILIERSQDGDCETGLAVPRLSGHGAAVWRRHQAFTNRVHMWR